MKYLPIFLCLFLAACDDLPKSGGNTGAYWYMKGWRTVKPGEVGQILTINKKGEPEWRDATPEELKDLESAHWKIYELDKPVAVSQ